MSGFYLKLSAKFYDLIKQILRISLRRMRGIFQFAFWILETRIYKILPSRYRIPSFSLCARVNKRWKRGKSECGRKIEGEGGEGGDGKEIGKRKAARETQKRKNSWVRCVSRTCACVHACVRVCLIVCVFVWSMPRVIRLN